MSAPGGGGGGGAAAASAACGPGQPGRAVHPAGASATCPTSSRGARRTNPTPAVQPTDLHALLRRRECNRHTYSRLVPINASTTKAACDGECGRI